MTRANHILAIDQGTTSSRALVFDHDARPIAVAQQATIQHFPESGWVNQDASNIWQTTLATAREALEQAELRPEAIAAIGIANQRETLVVWERRSGEPVAPAIVWQSRQSQPQVDALIARGLSQTYQEITGLVPDPYFTATKIVWLFDRDPDLRRRAEQGDVLAGTIDSWLIWKLTGGATHTTDVSNASRTMLFDIRTRAWSAPLLADLGIPRAMLPTVLPNAGHIGSTAPDLFGAEIPITGSAGDQQAALFGQTCFAAGEAKNTYGTGSFLLMNTGRSLRRSSHRLLSTVAWQIGPEVVYALEGAVFVSGAAVQWLRDGLGIIASAEEIEALAASVPDSGGVSFVPALTGLGAPYWDSGARGALLGLTRGSTRAHIARATLEAIAMQTRDVTDAMAADAEVALTSLKVDGGAARNNLLLQIQADVLGVPVIRPKNVETTALGAAYLAGLGSGLWPGQDAIAALWEIDAVFEPRIDAAERDSRYAQWRRAVERSRDWIPGAE